MLKYRESLVSAHHNYLVNQMLCPAFLLGDSGSKDDFYFLADGVPAGQNEPRIFARLYDAQGVFLVELEPKRIVESRRGVLRLPFPGGYRIAFPSGEPLLTVQTESFANGSLTRIQGKLHDRKGALRAEPFLDGLRVVGEETLALSDRNPVLLG